ncbi:hypothetical protein GCM10011587_02250 [Pyruvatibacter mobilis]|nr:hypothetical protein GCM10011587_02250 [Pyruvatibacter mobilis]
MGCERPAAHSRAVGLKRCFALMGEVEPAATHVELKAVTRHRGEPGAYAALRQKQCDRSACIRCRDGGHKAANAAADNNEISLNVANGVCCRHLRLHPAAGDELEIVGIAAFAEAFGNGDKLLA